MKKLIRLGGLLLLCLSASLSVRAQLTVQPTVSFSSGLFNYSYSVSNQTPFDVSIVTLSGIFSAPNAVQNLHAPVGFLASYDTGLNLLSFIEDTQSFAAGLSSGPFTFDSPYAPSAGGFEAIDITGNLIAGITSVPGAAGIGAVPEPSTTALLGAVALLGVIFRRKFLIRKNSQS